MRTITLRNILYILLVFSLGFAILSCNENRNQKLEGNNYLEQLSFKTVSTLNDSNIIVQPLDLDKLPNRNLKSSKIETIGDNRIILKNKVPNIAEIKEITVSISPKKVKLKDVKQADQLKPFPFVVAKDMASKDINPQSFTSFDKLQGLSHSFITSMMEDHQGALWFGTHNGGITKFDGKYFTYINTEDGLASNIVFAMCQMKNLDIWIGAYGGGLSIYNGQGFTNITESNGLISNKIYDIAEDKKGRKWIATQGGVLVFNRDHYKDYTLYNSKNGFGTDSISSVMVDTKERVWIGTEGSGLYYMENDKIFKYGINDERLANALITKIDQGSDGVIWVSTYGQGLIQINENDYINWTTDDGLPADDLTSVEVSNSGKVWIGSDGGGVFSFSSKKSLPSELLVYTQEHGLTNANIFSVLEDKENTIWVGTQRGGVNKFNGNKFTHFQNFSTTAQFIYTINEDKNHYWLGSSGSGLYMIDKLSGSMNNLSSSNGFPDDRILSSLLDRKGNMWLGTREQGIIIVKDQQYKLIDKDKGLTPNGAFSFFQDSKNNIWIGTYDGLSIFNGAELITLSHFNSKDMSIPFDIQEDNQGRIWVATEEDGVFIIENNEIKQVISKNILNTDVAYALAKDEDGNIWIGTEKGVMVSNGQSLYTINEELGLTNRYVISLMNDDKNNLWIGTRRGVNILTNEKRILLLNNIKSKNVVSIVDNYFKTYAYEDGFTGLGCNRGAIFQSKDGQVWIGTTDKLTLSTISMDGLDSKISPPTVQLKKIDIHNEAVDYQHFLLKSKKQQELGNGITVKNLKFTNFSKWTTLPENLSLKYDNNYLSFHFIGITMSQAGKVKYQYKLEGYEDKWSVLRPENVAHYGNLGPGDYTFVVKAKGGDGGISDEEKFSFTIRQPWWFTWWMKMFYIFAIGMVFFFIQKNQKAKTIKNERLKSQAKELEQAKEIEKAYSELKETQNQLIQAEKMASLGELTAGISHEIQNPLNFINNFAEVSTEMIDELHEEIKNNDLNEVASLADMLKLNLEKITHHGKRAESIVKSMLLHSRNSVGQKEPTDLNALCDEYLRLSYHGYRAKDKTFNSSFDVILDPNLPLIEIVPQDMGRVILNLLNNAFYAVHQKQTEGMATPDYAPKVTIETKLLTNSVLIKIKDNGKGMPKNIISKIFQPFFTTKPTGQGTGLGLSLAYDIVSKHNGKLEVETEEGQGTEFDIELPITHK